MVETEKHSERIIVCADHIIGYRLVEFILQHGNKLNIDLLRVYTSKENESHWWTPLKTLQSRFNFDLRIYDPATFENECSNTAPDYLFLLSWKYILPVNSISIAKKGCINLHYSLLPGNKGVYPLNFALMKGETHTGITFHFVSPVVDGGDIIVQQQFEIFSWDTTASLLPRADEVAFNLFTGMVKKLSETGALNHSPQLANNASYNSGKDYRKLDEIDLNKVVKAGEFINLLRGKSFEPHKKSLFFKDPETGGKVFVSINLDPDSTD